MGNSGGQEVCGPIGVQEGGENLATLFYADDGILVYLCLARLKEYLDVLVGLFDRVGLRNNV